MAKASKSESRNHKAAPTSKNRKISSTQSQKDVATKVDFQKWLDDYATGKTVVKLQETAPLLTPEYRKVASELLVALKESEARPSAKFKIERLSESFLKSFTSKSQNPFFLIFILCSESTSSPVRESAILSLMRSEVSEERLTYLLGRLASIKKVSAKERLWNTLIAGDLFQSKGWIDAQLAILEWGILQGLKVAEPSTTFLALRRAAEQFKEAEATRQRKILKKLLEMSPYLTVVFVMHLTTYTNIVKTLLELVQGKEDLFLLSYFKNRKDLFGVWTDDFENKILVPILKVRIDAIMTFSDLLPLLEYSQSLNSHLPADLLSRAVARSFRREDELASLLADRRVMGLESQVESLSVERDVLSTRLESQINKSNSLENKVRDFEVAIESYEMRLRNQMKSESVGTDALAQSAKADLLKNILEGLDHLFMGAEGFALEKALQKIGVQRLGTPGDRYNWDPTTCESLTGEEIGGGVVVRSGYTWLDGGKKTTIRRVLLKKG